MIALLLLNLRWRLSEWLHKPHKDDVPRWTYKQIGRLP
jgi:hypothetical protein